MRAVVSLGIINFLLVGARPAWAIGPSFDCAKVATPSAQVICASPDLSRLDLEFVQAYYALRQQVGAAGEAALKREDLAFLAMVLRVCQVPAFGPPPPASPALIQCIASQYQGQRNAWLARLSGPAREEATRPIDEHVDLQRCRRKSG